jgi:hypothetical protein
MNDKKAIKRTEKKIGTLKMSVIQEDEEESMEDLS